jgi:hypothetical protein
MPIPDGALGDDAISLPADPFDDSIIPGSTVAVLS